MVWSFILRAFRGEASRPRERSVPHGDFTGSTPGDDY